MADGQTTASQQTREPAQGVDPSTGEIIRLQGASLPRPVAPVAEIQTAIAEHHAIVKALMAPEDYTTYKDRDGKVKTIPNKSYFLKLGSFYGLSVEISNDQPVYHLDPSTGRPLWAEAHIRVSTPNGRSIDGYGACSITESRFQSEKGAPRATHDLGSTAITRATNRAIGLMFPFAADALQSWEDVEGGPMPGDAPGRSPSRAGRSNEVPLRPDQEAVKTALTQLADLRNGNGENPKTNWATILWKEVLPEQPSKQRDLKHLTEAECESILDHVHEAIGKEADTIDGEFAVAEEV